MAILARLFIIVILSLYGCGGGSNDEAPHNTAPVANAGPDQSLMVNDNVALNGNQSSDADQDQLTYFWTFFSTPQGSTATLTSHQTSQPNFIADLAGEYHITLVVNDGQTDSDSDTVVITAELQNTPPTANAGPDQQVEVGSMVSLDGSQSSDANNDILSYSWSFQARPQSSTTVIADASTTTPSFIPDVTGYFSIELIVDDGQGGMSSDLVSIQVVEANIAPIANAGDDRDETLGNTVTLDGSQSNDTNLDPLTYHWSITSKPEGSASTLTLRRPPLVNR